ncbi:BTH_I0359 family protein [Pseudorhodoferax sp.]|uniref:BTH_I0359 family protein n=1 Tax=Pseudorhodoferax sp. TaxID=1993553 RepID=UPI002DD68FA1|nr:DUF3567 domain-containing protein [Pseudorhodoferax sp.]
MQMVYNSDSFVVVRFEMAQPAGGDGDGVVADGLGRGGFEIVDKLTRKEIFLDGLLAESFSHGVQALADSLGDAEGAGPEAFDEFIAGYTVLAQQPVVAH